MSLKIRNKLLVAFLGLIIVILAVAGTTGYYNQRCSDEAVRRVQAISEEVVATARLGHALEHAIMPANDYLITGNRLYADDFKKVSAEMEERISETKKILEHLYVLRLPKVEDERNWLKEIETAWQNIKELSLRIFEMPDPIGNRDGAKLMEEMDYRWARHATDLIHKWHEVDTEEYGEAVGAAERAKRLSWGIMSASGILLLGLGAGFAVFYSRLFVRPIEAIHNGADAIAAGNFKTRLDIKTGDEIEQLSNAMNEMAEQLDAFTANLQGMVEERTRELQESEERYRGIFEKTPNAMVVFDAETWRFEYVNRAAIELYGYTEEEFLSMTPADVSAEVEKTRQSIQNGLAAKSAHVPVRYHKKKDGTVFPIEIFMGTFLSNGRRKGFAVIMDLTEIKKREEMLLESEERYRVLGMTAPNAFICLKAPDTITFWNRRATEIFGYSEEEAIGMPMHGLIVPGKYREKAGEGLKNFFKTGTGAIVGKKTELSALRRDGTEFPIELSLSAMNIRGEWQATGIVRDITERKQAEEIIKKERDLAQTYLDIAGVMFVVIDPNEKVTLVNKKGAEVLGFPEGEVIGKNWFDNFLPERARDEIRGVFRKLIRGEDDSVEYVENPVLTCSGEERLIAWHNTVLKDEAGNIIATLSSGEDITDREKADEALKQRINELEQFRKVTIKRELRMEELQRKVEELEKELKRR